MAIKANTTDPMLGSSASSAKPQGKQDSIAKNLTKSQMTNSIVGGGYSGSGGYGGGYGGDSSGSYGGNTMNDYLAALQAQRDAAIAEANGLLDEQGRLAEQRYALQKEASDQDYQDLRNQSEVNRYKSKGTLRQSLADRGALDSGIGRQAYLSLSNNFDNALNRIGLQQKREDAERNQAINEMWNQIAMSKAANKMMGLDMMGNLLSQFDPSMLMSSIGGGGGYSYSPQTSSYYQAAQDATRGTPFISGGSAMGNGQYETGASSSARALAFNDLVNAARQRAEENKVYDPWADPNSWKNFTW